MRQNLDTATYDSISDFLSAVALPPVVPGNADLHSHYIHDTRNSSFYGADCHSGNDVIKLMQAGWPQGRDRLAELRSKMGEITVTPTDRRRRMVRADMGDALDIHAVYAGRLDIAWSTPRRVTTNAPQRIDIVANMICSGGEHPDVLFWRGAAAAVLTDMLESAGYMCRMTVNFGGTTFDHRLKVSCRITIKDHGMPFDITSTSAVILPGFFRALGHAWVCNHETDKASPSGISVGQGIVEPHEILLSHNVRDHGTAVAFVTDTIDKINQGGALQAA